MRVNFDANGEGEGEYGHGSNFKKSLLNGTAL